MLTRAAKVWLYVVPGFIALASFLGAGYYFHNLGSLILIAVPVYFVSLVLFRRFLIGYGEQVIAQLFKAALKNISPSGIVVLDLKPAEEDCGNPDCPVHGKEGLLNQLGRRKPPPGPRRDAKPNSKLN